MSAARLTTAQACKRAGVSRFVLLRAQKSGDLFGVKDNKGHWLWDAEGLDRWAEDRPIQVVPEPKKQEPQEEKRTDDAEKIAELAQALGHAEGLAEGLRVALENATQEADRWRTEAQEQRARADALARRPRGLWALITRS